MYPHIYVQKQCYHTVQSQLPHLYVAERSLCGVLTIGGKDTDRARAQSAVAHTINILFIDVQVKTAAPRYDREKVSLAWLCLNGGARGNKQRFIRPAAL